MAGRKPDTPSSSAHMVERAGLSLLADPARARRLADTRVTDENGDGWAIDAAGNVTRVRGGLPVPEAPTTETEEG